MKISCNFFQYLQGFEPCNTQSFETTYYRSWSGVKNRRRTPAPRAARDCTAAVFYFLPCGGILMVMSRPLALFASWKPEFESASTTDHVS